MSADLIRRCPSCGTENTPQVMRCRCGALLVGIDLVTPTVPPIPATPPVPPVQTVPPVSAISNTPIHCGFEDCAQPNPPGSHLCLYCNRPIDSAAPIPKDGPLQAALQPLLNLPAALKSAYRILHPLPTQGGEADLMLVEALAGGPPRVVKIYRHGLEPKATIYERLAKVDSKYRVPILEAGHSDGYFYEVMVFCEQGSWREQLKQGVLHECQLRDFVQQLAPALQAIHAADLIHRDLKPDNILIRSLNPLDLVLTDFGSASVLDATQRFTGAARTLSYAAPESLSGVLDAKADYWALGMMVLEGALGRHPFAGLSEAVILYHLTTRSMDLSGVPMAAINKLLRGLLLRDPKLRWGSDEVTRWLANDASLPEVVDTIANKLFQHPYHLGKELCYSSEQLAGAMARDWKTALADFENGQLMTWFRDVQKDQNTVRLLLGLKHDRPMQVDLRLLHLILHLAPGIAPVWKGAALDLRAVLSHAAQALKNDEAAIDWLDLLYRQDVLGLYANLGHQPSAVLLQRWNMAYDEFIAAWESLLPRLKSPERKRDDVLSFDEALYGNVALERPPLALMHARFLAISYDANWVERLRLRLKTELDGLRINCPWLDNLADVPTMTAPALLALEGLMPAMHKTQQEQQRNRERREAANQAALETMKNELALCIGNVQASVELRFYSQEDCIYARERLDQLLDCYAKLRAAGSTDPVWQRMDKEAESKRKIAVNMRRLADSLLERQVVNAAWLSRPSLGTAGLALVLTAILGDQRWVSLLLAATVGLVLWRLLPTFSMVQDLKAMAGKLRR